MERYFAEVISGKVARVIVSKPDFIETLQGTWIECGGNTDRNRVGLITALTNRTANPFRKLINGGS